MPQDLGITVAAAEEEMEAEEPALLRTTHPVVLTLLQTPAV